MSNPKPEIGRMVRYHVVRAGRERSGEYRETVQEYPAVVTRVHPDDRCDMTVFGHDFASGTMPATRVMTLGMAEAENRESGMRSVSAWWTWPPHVSAVQVSAGPYPDPTPDPIGSFSPVLLATDTEARARTAEARAKALRRLEEEDARGIGETSAGNEADMGPLPPGDPDPRD